MAQGITFRGHLLEMTKAKNTTTVILDRVPYGLPEASIKLTLARYGEVKSFRPVTHKGYGLSKFKVEMILAQDIPSRIAVQGNHLNSFYKNQPCSCFVCSSAGHEAKNCPKKAANKRPAPQDHSNNKAPRTYAEQTAPDSTARPPAGDQAAVPICSTTTDGVPPPPPPRGGPLLPTWSPRHTIHLPATPLTTQARRLSPALTLPPTSLTLWRQQKFNLKWT